VAVTGELSIVRFLPEYRDDIAQALTLTGWERRYVDGQLKAVDVFAADSENSRVFVAHQREFFAGYITVQFYEWNRLSQIHGLVVVPSMRQRSIAARLVQQAEDFVIARGGRGVYVDTPVTNSGAKAFYLKQGNQQDYIMTAYYDTNLDGVTYLKRFDGSASKSVYGKVINEPNDGSSPATWSHKSSPRWSAVIVHNLCSDDASD
jgi:ribosomal protein S18 acetylase RimI-like enzyme